MDAETSGLVSDAARVSGEARAAFSRFVDGCWSEPAAFSLTPGTEPSPYALCFGVYSLHLVGRTAELTTHRDDLTRALRTNLDEARKAAEGAQEAKPFRQLLTLTLSALAILGDLEADPLPALVEEQLPNSVEPALARLGALQGRAQSGNQAMFLAILLLHAWRYLGRDTTAQLDEWAALHRSAMNRFGFWGPDAGPTHLHFQNGYHQYEIFEYLGAENPGQQRAVATVARLADPHGHFAPYPGGGGCFDYDAVFVLTPNGRMPDAMTAALLRRTAATIAAEQQADGGFCESLRVRPRRRALTGYLERLASARNPALVKERLRYALTLQRPKHDRIHTHWARYHWRWDESNLWDSWFRMLTLARIECVFDPGRSAAWGFIDYPGIGWHASLRRAPGP